MVQHGSTTNILHLMECSRSSQRILYHLYNPILLEGCESPCQLDIPQCHRYAATSSGNIQDLFAPRDSDLFTPTSIGVGVFDFSFCWNRHARNMVREQLFNIMICQCFTEMEGGLYSKGVQNWMFQDLQSCSLVDQFASLACGHNTCYFIKHVFILLFCSCTSWVTWSREWALVNFS